MAGEQSTARVFEDLTYDDARTLSRLGEAQDRFRDGARAGFFRVGKLLRMSWVTLDNVNPEDIPWAEPNGSKPSHSGRVAVVRAAWSAVGDAGGLHRERQVAVRERDGQVQVSNGFEEGLFHWSDDGEFTSGVFAESSEGRAALGVRKGPTLAIPSGLVLVEQISPKELRDNYPDVNLAA
jgi:hypothetical protein